MLSNTGSATALGLTHRRAWCGDGTGSHPSPSLLDRQRSSEGTRHVKTLVFLIVLIALLLLLAKGLRGVQKPSAPIVPAE
jgi:hypothetical protein